MKFDEFDPASWQEDGLLVEPPAPPVPILRSSADRRQERSPVNMVVAATLLGVAVVGAAIALSVRITDGNSPHPVLASSADPEMCVDSLRGMTFEAEHQPPDWGMIARQMASYPRLPPEDKDVEVPESFI